MGSVVCLGMSWSIISTLGFIKHLFLSVGMTDLLCNSNLSFDQCGIMGVIYNLRFCVQAFLLPGLDALSPV